METEAPKTCNCNHACAFHNEQGNCDCQEGCMCEECQMNKMKAISLSL